MQGGIENAAKGVWGGFIMVLGMLRKERGDRLSILSFLQYIFLWGGGSGEQLLACLAKGGRCLFLLL